MTEPEVGFSNKLTQRISVLLPAPEAPITPHIFPFGTFKLTLLSAVSLLPEISKTFCNIC